METFVGGVGVLLVGAVGWLSYYKRKWYLQHLERALIHGGVVSAIVGCTIWLLADSMAGLTDTGAIKPEAIRDVAAMFDHLKRKAEIILLFTFIAGMLMIMLRAVPPHGKQQ